MNVSPYVHSRFMPSKPGVSASKISIHLLTEPAPVQTIDVEKEVTGLTVHFTETPGDKNYFLVSISEEGSLVSL